MNIDDYRAEVARQKEEADSQVEQPATPETVANPIVEAPATEAPIVEDAPVTQTTPQVIEIDGKEVPIEELKGGYLRQADYTRKTQELARDKEKAQIAQQYYDVISARPDVAKQFAENFNLPYVDPEQAKVTDLERKYQDLLLTREVELLSVKYPDFNETEVLRFAHDEKIDKLENAYLLSKARTGAQSTGTVDVASLTEQIRQQVLQELQSNVDTGSIIGTGGSAKPVSPDVPTLTPAQAKVAKSMGMSPAEYSKWL